MSRRPIQLVCFDLGGVLVRICRTWEEACSRAGIDLRAGDEWERLRPARREITRLYGIGRIDCQQYFRDVSHAMGGLYSPEEVQRVHHAWTIEDYPGAGRVLERLNEAGVRTACLSNTNRSHWIRLIHHDGARDLPGEPEFPVVRLIREQYASHLLGAAKPDPSIYAAFLRAVDVSPDRILFFDDLEENIAAARQAGWIARLIDYQADTAGQIEAHLRDLGVPA